MNHYTTISQSKKLLSLGLSPETSDMIYSMVNGRSTPFIRLEKISELDELDDVVCWSLGALLEVMPKEEVPALYCSLLYDELKWFCSWDNGKFVQAGDSPIEVAYSMMCWLLENNYLKTESPLTPPINK